MGYVGNHITRRQLESKLLSLVETLHDGKGLDARSAHEALLEENYYVSKDTIRDTLDRLKRRGLVRDPYLGFGIKRLRVYAPVPLQDDVTP